MAANDSEIALRIRAAVDGLGEIATLIQHIDQLGGESDSASGEVEQLGQELKQLGAQQQAVEQFSSLKSASRELAQGLEQARERATTMGKAIATSGQQLAAQQQQAASSRRETEQLGTAYAQARAKVELLQQQQQASTVVTRDNRQELAAARRELGEIGRAYQASAKQSGQLANAVKAQDKALNASRREFDAARRDVRALDTQYQQQQRTLNELRAQLSAAGLSTKALGREQQRLATQSAQAEQQIERLAEQLRRQANELKQSGQAARNYSQTARQAAQSSVELNQSVAESGGWRDWIGRVTGAAAAYLSFDQLLQRARGMVTTADEMERLSVSLASVEGSAAQGQAALAWLREFAAQTPYQLSELTQAFITAKNFGLDPFGGALQAAADYTAKTGGSYQELQGILTALGQAYTKGKLQAEEMNQLNERSVPAAQLLAKALGRTSDEIIAMASAGELGRQEIELLIKAMGEDAVGASAAMSKTFSGVWSNFIEELKKAELAVADAGIFEQLKAQLLGLTQAIQRAAADGSLAAWAKQISDAMRGAMDAISATAKTLYEWRGALEVVGKTWLGLKIGGWVASLAALYKQFFALPVATAAASAGMGTLGTAAAVTTASLTALGVALKALLAYVAVESVIQISKFGFAVRDLVTAQDALRSSQAAAALSQTQLAERFSALSAELGITIDSMATLEALVREGKVHYDEASGSWQTGAEAMGALGSAAQTTRDYLAEVNAAAAQTAKDGSAALSAAFKQLGLDFEQAHGRIGAGFTDTLSALDILVKHTGSSSAAIKQALEAAFDRAKTQAEIDAITDRVQRLGEQGQLSAADIAQAMARARGEVENLGAASSDTGKKVQGIAGSYRDVASAASSANNALSSEFSQLTGQIERLKQELESVKQQLSDAKQTAADTRSELSRDAPAVTQDAPRREKFGNFYYQGLDLNQLRGDQAALEKALVNVEKELSAYRHKVTDNRSDGNLRFLTQMEASQRALREELAAIRRSEQQQQRAATRVEQTVRIELKTPTGQNLTLGADPTSADGLIKLLEQQGLRQ
ncbi:MAG: tape measure protein [Aeromonas sp.]